MPTDAVLDAIAAIREGAFVIVVDDDDPTNEGGLVMAAEAATVDRLAFMLAHTSGVLCAPLGDEEADRLCLPATPADSGGGHRTALSVSVEACGGPDDTVAAQAQLLRGLASRCFEPGQLQRPGHTFPLRARPGGVLKRAGHTEAAVDLCRLAGRGDVAALGEIVDDQGALRRLPSLREFADCHAMPMVSIADLIRHRREQDRLIERTAEARIPTEHGEFVAHAFRSIADGDEHVAYVMGDVRNGPAPLVRVHSECLTGDILASNRCDCGDQLQLALRTIAHEGRGVLLYLRGHEGRGIGLGHKLRAYALQDRGLDTVDANAALGFPIDSREYGIGAQILAELGIAEMRLLTNNPDKLGGLEGFGLEVVERVPIETRPRAENIRYLETKRRRMGHFLGDSEIRA